MATTESARIAFVGAGNHSSGSLYPNIPQIPAFDLVAICDLDAAKAQERAHSYGAEAFTDVTEMLDKVQPQGVGICGSFSMHHDIGLEVLRRGIPIYIEKPPGNTFAEAQELVDVAAAQGIWGMAAFMKRFAPANLVAKEYMASEAFGPLCSVSLIHSCGPYTGSDTRTMLMGNGIHLIDLGRFYAGDIAELFAYEYTDHQAVHAISATLRFASGAVGQFNLNSGAHWTDCLEQTYLCGQGVGVRVDNSQEVEVMSMAGRFAEGKGLSLFGWSNRYYVSGNMSGWEAGGHYTRGYHGEMQAFARAVLGLEKPTSTLEDAAASMAIIDRIMQSVETGAPA